MYGAEQCRLFRQRFGIDVAVSTMWRFVHQECGLSRKRLGKPSPFDSLSDANRERRRAFVAEHFDSATLDTVGTSDELADQKKWCLKKSKNKKNLKRVEQLFFVDETGCNRHTLHRTHGYAPRGKAAIAKTGGKAYAKGRNHSVIIAIGGGAAAGVLAHRILVGRGRGTRRDDFCGFLRRDVAPALLRAADRAGLPKRAPLYLMMDNASIHKGAVVSQALRSVSTRLHVAYQPPYMPNVNPVELVNNDLKQHLRRQQLEWLAETGTYQIEPTIGEDCKGVCTLTTNGEKKVSIFVCHIHFRALSQSVRIRNPNRKELSIKSKRKQAKNLTTRRTTRR